MTTNDRRWRPKDVYRDNPEHQRIRRIWGMVSLLPEPEVDKSYALSVVTNDRRGDNSDIVITGAELSEEDRKIFADHLARAYRFYEKCVKQQAVDTLSNKSVVENFYQILRGEEQE